MRPTILVDMDGPLADFDRHYAAPFNAPGTKHGQDWPRFTWTDGIARLVEMAWAS